MKAKFCCDPKCNKPYALALPNCPYCGGNNYIPIDIDESDFKRKTDIYYQEWLAKQEGWSPS